MTSITLHLEYIDFVDKSVKNTIRILYDKGMFDIYDIKDEAKKICSKFIKRRS